MNSLTMCGRLKKKSNSLSPHPVPSSYWFIFQNFLTSSQMSHSVLSKYAMCFSITMSLLMLFPLLEMPATNSLPVGMLPML